MPEQTAQLDDAPAGTFGDRSIAVAFGGSGTRSWRAIERRIGPRAPNEAFVIRRADVQRRLTLALDDDHRVARIQAQAFLGDVDAVLRRGLGVAGFIGYEVGAALENIPSHPSALTGALDAELVVFDPSAIARVLLPPTPAQPRDRRPSLPDSLTKQRAAFIDAVIEAHGSIRAGAIYQVNLSVAADVPAGRSLQSAPLTQLLRLILDAQDVPFGFAFDGTSGRLLSGSMERFLTRDGPDISSRPIKGTFLRGKGPDDDEEHRQRLIDSPKERAENTMIVDMVRNDLARVCTPGSVAVPELLQTVPYRTLWHLESEVSGRLASDVDNAAVLAATLPPASVTGCPKIAAMRIIAALESRRRHAYCGTIGVAIGPDFADWSVAIRTVAVHRNVARIDVGAGIVAGSDPEREWRETCAKARSALSFIERANDLTDRDSASHFEAGSELIPVDSPTTTLPLPEDRTRPPRRMK